MQFFPNYLITMTAHIALGVVCCGVSDVWCVCTACVTRHDRHKHSQVPESNGGMDIKLRYTGEEFVDMKT